jgi:hypothetical protein
MNRNQSRMLGILAGAAFALIILVVYLVLTGPGRMAVVEEDAFAAAIQKWEAAKINSYHVEVEVRGRQPATYKVEVLDGKVQTATRNDNPLKQHRTLDTWTVPGMFNTMSIDLDHRARHAEGKAEPGEPNVRVRAIFDEKLGYPARYHRTEFVKRGTNPTTSWTVVKLEVVR